MVNIIFDRRRSFTKISVVTLRAMAKLRLLPTFLARIWARQEKIKILRFYQEHTSEPRLARQTRPVN